MADAAAELDEGGLARTLKDLFAGAAGGIAQVLLGEFGACSWISPLGIFVYWSRGSSKWDILLRRVHILAVLESREWFNSFFKIY